MAKKSKRTVHSANVLFADEAATNEAQDNKVISQAQDARQKSFWSGLGRGERIAAIAVCLLLVMGALGAGVGNKIISVFNSKDSKQNVNQPAQNNSYLSTINPLTPDPTPTPLPLSKEYIYAGSRMLAVEDKNASALPPTDLAVWRPSSGYWYVYGGQSVQWGGIVNNVADVPVPGDYDGDGKTDFSVFRPSTGYWYISNSSNGYTIELASFGASDDRMAQADYDGDGRTDAAVYRPSTGYWYIKRSSDSGTTYQQFGLSTDTPVPADFDGDGKADFAVWRNSDAKFYILRSSDAALQTIVFGHTNDTPVIGDFDGDGKADAALWRPTGASNNEAYQWQIRYSSDNSYHAYSMGDPASDKAVQNDYDGDGKVDVAIWRPSDGTWYIQQSSLGGQARNVQWGANGDTPVPAFYRR